MAIANYFYNSTTRKYVAIFGTLFNQIKIKREDTDGTVQKEMIVPLSYAPFQKILARVQADPDLQNSRRPAMMLPRMSFEITNMTYDPARKISTTKKVNKPNKEETNDSRDFIYSPVPYNLDFSLYIMTKYAEDATKITEQILPFFTPDWTVAATMIPDLDPIDIPIVLNSVTNEEIYEGGFEERQSVLYTLNFTLKGWFFGPERRKKVIKFVDVDMFGDTATDASFLTGIDIRPGLTANGEPLTVDGLQATATATLTNGSVSAIVVNENGENYNANTTVTISAPDTANAAVTATMSGGALSGLTVVEGGGFFSTLPTVNISAPDAASTTATASATVTGDVISSLDVVTPGTFYNTASVSITPPPNKSPVFKFGDDALWHDDHDDAELLYTHNGYFSSATGYRVEFWIYPTSFPSGNPLTVLFAPFTKIFFNAADGQLQFKYGSTPTLNSGMNLILNQWNHVRFEHSSNDTRFSLNGTVGTTFSTGTGNVLLPNHNVKAGDALGNESVFDGANRGFIGYLDNVSWTTQATLDGTDGSTYALPTAPVTGDLFTSDFNKDLPSATAVITAGELTGITIDNAGSGYANTSPTVTISDPDDIPATFNATATPVLTDGAITSLTIDYAGKFYVNTPSVTVSAPTATTATAIPVVATNGDIQSITVTNAGLGYRTTPSVFITSPDFGSIPYTDIEFDDNWGIIKTIVSE